MILDDSTLLHERIQYFSLENGLLWTWFLNGQSEIIKHDRWNAKNPEYQKLMDAFVESIKNVLFQRDASY